MRAASTPKLNLATKIFHVDPFVVLFSSSFFLCGDLKFDLMFLTQLIWWIRTCQIFKKFDQTKMSQILLYALSNLFDSTNLIKLIWPHIGGNLVVGLNNCATFVFLKTVLVNVFVKTCTSVNLFVFLALFPVTFLKNFFFDFQWSLNLRCLPWFLHTLFWAMDFSSVG